jgi:hypothetical protein
VALRVEVEATRAGELDLAERLSRRQRDLLFRNLRDNPMLGERGPEEGREYGLGGCVVFHFPILDSEPAKVIIWKVLPADDPLFRSRRTAGRRRRLGQVWRALLPYLKGI